MDRWFECKMGYEKRMEKGMKKKVREGYVVDGVSFREGEGGMMEEMRGFI